MRLIVFSWWTFVYWVREWRLSILGKFGLRSRFSIARFHSPFFKGRATRRTEAQISVTRLSSISYEH